ncbi:MAG: hypothetical protein GKR93_19705 [Gammaproteobacteria bacterium]|nr:hypothetical protein [Gammaproteobacteria bacterium]
MNHSMIVILLLIITSRAFGAGEQTYPNVPGEILMEDDRVIVQKFVLEPGQWEGIHSHPEHQLVITLKRSDEVTYRIGDKETKFKFTEEDLRNKSHSVFWRPGPVHLSDQHESGNTGSKTLEWIAITFKRDSIASDPVESLVPQTR